MVKSIAKWVLSVFPDQEYYNKGDYIIREGEEGNTFYVIANGKVICNILSSKKTFSAMKYEHIQDELDVTFQYDHYWFPSTQKRLVVI